MNCSARFHTVFHKKFAYIPIFRIKHAGCDVNHIKISKNIFIYSYNMLTEILSLFSNNVLAFAAAAILLLLLFYKKPKVFLALFLIAVILGATLYVIVSLSSGAVHYKKELISKSERELF
jgi:hypothetical protein